MLSNVIKLRDSIDKTYRFITYRAQFTHPDYSANWRMVDPLSTVR